MKTKKFLKKFLAIFATVLALALTCVPAFAAETEPAAADQLAGAIHGMEDVATAFMGADGIWQQLINFVVANPICLVGLFSFLLVLGVGMVRRLFTA